MSLKINTNMSAVTAGRNVSNGYSRLAEHAVRLSSGLRINSSAHDAAGLAVRESLRAETAGLHQAVRNANDLISLGQTADGAMSAVDDNLIRMRELAEQAASATYSPQQRKIMAQEFDVLAGEIDRIVGSTAFNDSKPLAEAVAAPGGHLGEGLGLDVSADAATLTGMTFADADYDTADLQALAQGAIDSVDTAIATAGGLRATLGSYQNRLATRATNLTVQAETTTAAEARISDVDVATEMAALVQSQVLMQSSLAMMAQAHATSQMTMKLVQ